MKCNALGIAFIGLLGVSLKTLSAEVIVSASGLSFEPPNVEINVGDTVTWRGLDGFHTATSGTNCSADGQWGSASGATSFSHTFAKAGTFSYFCSPHCDFGMKGTVTVKDAPSAEDARIERGLAIAPVRLRYLPRNRRRVGLGSYIVNAQGSCADCHSCPTFRTGGNPFKGEPPQFRRLGYLAGGVPFGPFRSRNLTRDASGRPAGLTLTQFKVAMRTGKDFKNAHPQISPLLQVMPWPMIGRMTDDDLTAVYQYLRAVPAAQANPALCTGPGQ